MKEMSYPSKTFKVRPLYKVLYQSCIDVLNKQKTPLMRALLREQIGISNYEKTFRFDFNELISYMVDNLKNELLKKNYEELDIEIRTNPRFKKIRDLFDQKAVSNNLVMISFRIPDSLIKQIYSLKLNNLGNVIEMSIGLFLIQCEEVIFNLICLSFSHY